jgi:hypothetical protein
MLMVNEKVTRQVYGVIWGTAFRLSVRTEKNHDMPGRVTVFTVAIRSTASFGKAIIKSLTAMWNIHEKHHRHRTYVRPSAQCRAVSGTPEHSLVSPTETDGERLRRQASRLGAVYAQVQETPTLLSERSRHSKELGTDLAIIVCFCSLSSVLKYE